MVLECTGEADWHVLFMGSVCLAQQKECCCGERFAILCCGGKYRQHVLGRQVHEGGSAKGRVRNWEDVVLIYGTTNGSFTIPSPYEYATLNA